MSDRITTPEVLDALARRIVAIAQQCDVEDLTDDKWLIDMVVSELASFRPERPSDLAAEADVERLTREVQGLLRDRADLAAEVERLRVDAVVAQRNAEAWRTEAEEQRPVLAYHKIQRDEARAALSAIVARIKALADDCGGWSVDAADIRALLAGREADQTTAAHGAGVEHDGIPCALTDGEADR